MLKLNIYGPGSNNRFLPFILYCLFLFYQIIFNFSTNLRLWPFIVSK